MVFLCSSAVVVFCFCFVCVCVCGCVCVCVCVCVCACDYCILSDIPKAVAEISYCTVWSAVQHCHSCCRLLKGTGRAGVSTSGSAPLVVALVVVVVL